MVYTQNDLQINNFFTRLLSGKNPIRMAPGHTNEGMDHLNLHWEDPPKMGRRREGE